MKNNDYFNNVIIVLIMIGFVLEVREQRRQWRFVLIVVGDFRWFGVEVVVWCEVHCRLRGPGIQPLERGGHILNQSSINRSLVSKLHLPLSSFVAKRNFTTEGCIPGPLRLDSATSPSFCWWRPSFFDQIGIFCAS